MIIKKTSNCEQTKVIQPFLSGKEGMEQHKQSLMNEYDHKHWSHAILRIIGNSSLERQITGVLFILS